MIPVITSNPIFHNVQISTGNILNVDNKLGRKTSEELIDGLKLTLLCSESKCVEINEADGRVLRATTELKQKLTENGRPEISIGAKIFLNKDSNECIDKAVEALLEILKVDHVDNVVLAYHPKALANSSTPTTPNPTITDGGGGIFKWSTYSDESVGQLKEFWKSLEKYAQQKKITQLGISDLDVETLTKLHETSSVKPTIAQINLSSCCVVPPPLQDFCTKHDIQLLTHSDPEILLPDENFIIPDYTVDWVIRYQVHVRCRGVLTAKGYILGASKCDEGRDTNSA